MLDSKILLVLKDLTKFKETIKIVKKEMKKMEKVENEQYEQLKKMNKEMRAQMKEIEVNWRNEILQDADYAAFREELLQLEEDFAHSSEKLFEYVSKLPTKYVQMNLETEMGTLNVQIQPDMRVYVNGREEKKK